MRQWSVTCSTGGESAKSKVDPPADDPTPVDWEGRETATKEVEEVRERAGKGFEGHSLLVGLGHQ